MLIGEGPGERILRAPAATPEEATHFRVKATLASEDGALRLLSGWEDTDNHYVGELDVTDGVGQIRVGKVVEGSVSWLTGQVTMDDEDANWEEEHELTLCLTPGELTGEEEEHLVQAVPTSVLLATNWTDANNVLDDDGNVALYSIPTDSDADVLTHAVCEALLGSLALGDLGRLFPDTDPRYKGASSLGLLRAVMQLLSTKGARVINVDATVICQAPRLGAYLPDMARQIATTMELPVERVSVKAKSPEHLGLVGRGEGIASMAVVSVEAR